MAKSLRKCPACKGPAHTHAGKDRGNLPIMAWLEKRAQMVKHGHRFFPPAEGEPGYDDWFAGLMRHAREE